MPTMLYVGTEKGIVALKREHGDTFTIASHSLKGWEVPDVASTAAEPNRVAAGTRGDGVWLSEDAGQSWSKPSYGRPGPGKVRCVTVDPKDPRRLYAGCEPIDVFMSPDLGKNWERLVSIWDVPGVADVTYPVAVVEPHVRDITLDPNDTSKVYAALQVGSIAKSSDGGRSWKLIDADVDCDVHTIVVDPTNTSHIFVATGGHDSRGGRVKGKALYHSPDCAESWQPLAMEFNQEYSVPLIMHPANPKIMYSSLAVNQPSMWRKRDSGAESRVVRTEDGGRTWQTLSKGLPESREFIEAMAFNQSDPNQIFAGTRSGKLFASRDGGDSWHQLEVEVPSITSMVSVEA